MKTLIFAILVAAFGSAAAQTTHTWQLGIYDTTVDAAQALGTVIVKGVIYPANTPLSTPTSNLSMAVVRRYYLASLAADGGGILNSICPAEQSDQAATTQDELQAEANFLKGVTVSVASAVVTYGNYHIVFVKLSGPKVPLYIQNYVVKQVNGSYCMTHDLDADRTYVTVYELMMNYL